MIGTIVRLLWGAFSFLLLAGLFGASFFGLFLSALAPSDFVSLAIATSREGRPAAALSLVDFCQAQEIGDVESLEILRERLVPPPAERALRTFVPSGEASLDEDVLRGALVRRLGLDTSLGWSVFPGTWLTGTRESGATTGTVHAYGPGDLLRVEQVLASVGSDGAPTIVSAGKELATLLATAEKTLSTKGSNTSGIASPGEAGRALLTASSPEATTLLWTLYGNAGWHAASVWSILSMAASWEDLADASAMLERLGPENRAFLEITREWGLAASRRFGEIKAPQAFLEGLRRNPKGAFGLAAYLALREGDTRLASLGAVSPGIARLMVPAGRLFLLPAMLLNLLPPWGTPSVFLGAGSLLLLWIFLSLVSSRRRTDEEDLVEENGPKMNMSEDAVETERRSSPPKRGSGAGKRLGLGLAFLVLVVLAAGGGHFVLRNRLFQPSPHFRESRERHITGALSAFSGKAFSEAVATSATRTGNTVTTLADAWLDAQTRRLDADFLPWLTMAWQRWFVRTAPLLPSDGELVADTGELVQEAFALRVLRLHATSSEWKTMVERIAQTFGTTLDAALLPIKQAAEVDDPTWGRLLEGHFVLLVFPDGRTESVSLGNLLDDGQGLVPFLEASLKSLLKGQDGETTRSSPELPGETFRLVHRSGEPSWYRRAALARGALVAERVGGPLLPSLTDAGYIVMESLASGRSPLVEMPVLRRAFAESLSAQRTALAGDSAGGFRKALDFVTETLTRSIAQEETSGH
ncbi:hypothetical protein [Aminiphilus circumscriptus]|uniref:hypothetical protein n=1 Tax=Aminiphilus circumscriptus TaxID=290732 RepID=UPI000478590C|nr:hypothetical protein [Aminiphilus circumscriptus]